MNRKLITCIKYQILDFIKPLFVFYGIIYGLILISIIITANSGKISIPFSGLEINSFIFVAFCGVLTFTEDFKLFIQNGVTRKVIFKSFICEFTVVTFLMASIETVAAYILHTNFGYNYLFQMIYKDKTNIILSFFWLFTAYLMFSLIMYLAAVIKNKIGKNTFIISITGIALFILIIFPAVNIVTEGNLFKEVLPFLMKLMGFIDGKINLIYPVCTFSIIGIIAMIISYHFTKKTDVI